MPQLTEDDKTRLKTKLEGLRLRIEELKKADLIDPNTQRQMISVRERQCADIENLLGNKPEAPK